MQINGVCCFYFALVDAHTQHYLYMTRSLCSINPQKAAGALGHYTCSPDMWIHDAYVAEALIEEINFQV